MHQRFKKYLLGNIYQHQEMQNYHSAIFISYFLIIAIATLGFFTFFNIFINHHYTLASIDGIFAGFSAYILWDLKKRRDIKKSSALFIGMLFTILSLFFVVSKPESAAFVWVSCFIIAAFLVFGKKFGLLLSLLFCGTVFSYYFFSIETKITELGYTNLIVSTIVIVLFLLYYETSREAVFDRLQSTLLKLKQSHAKLESKSVTDPLTNIFNRAKAFELLTTAFNNRERYGTPFSVVFIDIDEFKAINDKYGHDAGDDMLVKYARLLSDNARKTDTLFRWGGEEFMLLCTNTDLSKATRLAENLRDLIAHENLGDTPLPSASYGVAEHQDGDNIEALIKRADSAMYDAKHAGGNCVKTL